MGTKLAELLQAREELGERITELATSARPDYVIREAGRALMEQLEQMEAAIAAHPDNPDRTGQTK